VFHRYGSQYFLAIVSEGSLDSTFGVYTSKEETQLANASPQKPVTTVGVVPSRGALQTTVSISEVMFWQSTQRKQSLRLYK
jgi:hypothetical protein